MPQNKQEFKNEVNSLSFSGIVKEALSKLSNDKTYYKEYNNIIIKTVIHKNKNKLIIEVSHNEIPEYEKKLKKILNILDFKKYIILLEKDKIVLNLLKIPSFFEENNEDKDMMTSIIENLDMLNINIEKNIFDNILNCFYTKIDYKVETYKHFEKLFKKLQIETKKEKKIIIDKIALLLIIYSIEN